MEDFTTWTIEISVHNTWIEDGFEMKEDHMEHFVEAMQNILPFAYGNEIHAKIIKKPTKKAIRYLQSGK